MRPALPCWPSKAELEKALLAREKALPQPDYIPKSARRCLGFDAALGATDARVERLGASEKVSPERPVVLGPDLPNAIVGRRSSGCEVGTGGGERQADVRCQATHCCHGAQSHQDYEQRVFGQILTCLIGPEPFQGFHDASSVGFPQRRAAKCGEPGRLAVHRCRAGISPFFIRQRAVACQQT